MKIIDEIAVMKIKTKCLKNNIKCKNYINKIHVIIL